jgi:hypothetical protein
MSLGGNIYQLALALLIGIVSGMKPRGPGMEAEHLAARASFIMGAALMLFSEKRWWPVTWTLFALMTWSLSGWTIAFAARRIVSLVRVRWIEPYFLKSRRADFCGQGSRLFSRILAKLRSPFAEVASLLFYLQRIPLRSIAPLASDGRNFFQSLQLLPGYPAHFEKRKDPRRSEGTLKFRCRTPARGGLSLDNTAVAQKPEIQRYSAAHTTSRHDGVTANEFRRE